MPVRLKPDTTYKTENALADYFKKAVEHCGEFLVRGPTQSPANALRREGANLTDLYPRTFGHLCGCELQRERVAGPRLLAGQRDRDHRARALVEDIVAQHQDRALARLFVPADGVDVGPSNLAS